MDNDFVGDRRRWRNVQFYSLGVKTLRRYKFQNEIVSDSTVVAAACGAALPALHLAATVIGARNALLHPEWKEFTRAMIGGVMARTAITLGLFAVGAFFMRNDLFVFGFSFICAYVPALTVEVYIIHKAQRKRSGSKTRRPMSQATESAEKEAAQ